MIIPFTVDLMLNVLLMEKFLRCARMLWVALRIVCNSPVQQRSYKLRDRNTRISKTFPATIVLIIFGYSGPCPLDICHQNLCKYLTLLHFKKSENLPKMKVATLKVRSYLHGWALANIA